MRRIVIVLCVLALFGAGHWYRHRPLTPTAGVLVEGAPLQIDPADRAPTTKGAFVLVPLADFSLDARVLSRQDYHFGTESDLSPTDLALGWDRMSDTAIIDQLDLSQSAR